MFKKDDCQTYETPVLDSTNPSSSPQTLLRNKQLLDTALDKIISYSEKKNINLCIFDNILNQLSKFDKTQSQIVELRFFQGLSTEEIAKMLDISTTKVKIEWQIAKMWIYSELKKSRA